MGLVWVDYVVVLTCVGEQGRNARIETCASKIPCMHVAVECRWKSRVEVVRKKRFRSRG